MRTPINTGAICAIIGFCFGPGNRLSFVLNPIVDNYYHGGIGGPEFNLATRLLRYNVRVNRALRIMATGNGSDDTCSPTFPV